MEKLPTKLISTVLYKKNIHAFFISHQVTNGLTSKMVWKLSNLLSYLQH